MEFRPSSRFKDFMNAVKGYEIASLEVLLALFSLILGIWILLTYRCMQDHEFKTIDRIIPEGCLGVILVFIAVVRLVGVYNYSDMVRFVGSILSFFVWTTITVSIWFENPLSFQIPTYGLISCFNFLIILKTARTIWSNHDNS